MYIVSHFISVWSQYKKPGNYRKVSSPDNTLCFPPLHSSFSPSCCDAAERQCAYSAVSNRSDTSSHDEDRYHQRTNYSDSSPQSLDLSLHHMRLYSFSRIVPVTVYVFHEITVCHYRSVSYFYIYRPSCAALFKLFAKGQIQPETKKHFSKTAI